MRNKAIDLEAANKEKSLYQALKLILILPGINLGFNTRLSKKL